MSISFWVTFLFASPPAPHAANTCSATGTPLVEIREGSDDSKQSTTTRIFNSGAWTIDRGRRVTEQGCLDKKELRQIRRAVQRAPWKITSSPIACFAYDPNFTEYAINGRVRFTERMCSGKTADTATLRAIDLVKAEIAEERAEHTPPPPVKPLPPKPVTPPPVKPMPPIVQPVPPIKPLPPVATCAPAGTPLFEIRHRSEMAEPTWTTSIYSNGAWTYQPVDKDGHLAASASGCLDKRTLISLRDVINQSPWDMTKAQMTCRAYSPSYTEYYVRGQREYTARLCGAERLDDKSLGAIKIIEDELAKVLPARS